MVAIMPNESWRRQENNLAVTAQGFVGIIPGLEKEPKSGNAVDLHFRAKLLLGMRTANQTVTDVATALGVSRETVRLWRAGNVPKERNLKLLATLIGVKPEDLRYSAKPARLTMVVPTAAENDDEAALLVTYRNLPSYAQKAVRARAVELLETFAPPSTANPNGKGRKVQ